MIDSVLISAHYVNNELRSCAKDRFQYATQNVSEEHTASLREVADLRISRRGIACKVCHRGRFPVMITSHKDHGPGQTAGKYAQHRQVSLSQHFTSHLILLRPALYVVKEWSLGSGEDAGTEKALRRMALAVRE